MALGSYGLRGTKQEEAMDKPYPKHVYHEKSDSELSYIIGDANEARLASRGGSLMIEVKYLRQIEAASAIAGSFSYD